MPTATLTRSLSTLSMPQYVIADYEYVMGADSTAFIIIDLPALYTTEPSYREELRTRLTAKAYAIDLCNFSISCGSTNFDVKVLDKNDESLVGTIYEVLSYTAINKSELSIFDRFIIRNEDTIPINRIYLVLTSSAGVVGTVLLQLAYTTLQDRVPVEN